MTFELKEEMLMSRIEQSRKMGNKNKRTDTGDVETHKKGQYGFFKFTNLKKKPNVNKK